MDSSPIRIDRQKTTVKKMGPGKNIKSKMVIGIFFVLRITSMTIPRKIRLPTIKKDSIFDMVISSLTFILVRSISITGFFFSRLQALHRYLYSLYKQEFLPRH